jgi:hypothetical protein
VALSAASTDATVEDLAADFTAVSVGCISETEKLHKSARRQ